jgi:hypothetical protein
MFNTQILAGSSGQGGETQQSLKFNDDESQYLSRTPAAAGNRKTWTWSSWVKRGNISSFQALFASHSALNDAGFMYSAFNNDDTLFLSIYSTTLITTSQVFRDVSAWYHIVFAFDATQATASDRLKLYVNGVEVTSFGTDNRSSISNTNYAWNQADKHFISGRYVNGWASPIDGYLSDINFIDGQALDASSFGQFTNGYWKKKDYAGTYGTNGFHLTFQDDVVSEGFNTVTYKGTGATQSISGLGFAPDLVWTKARDITYSNLLVDSVRGVTKELRANGTNAEATNSGVTSFDADGYTLGSYDDYNRSVNTFVAWCWDAGSGSPVSNTDGSITSTVKANPDYGFSIVSYTGTFAAATVGHGLSSAPELIIVKNRSTTTNWWVGSDALGGWDKYLGLDLTNAVGTVTSIWNGTAPTSTVFSVANDGGSNGSGNSIVAYCFNSVAGYSSIGTYSGTDSPGVTVTTGFRPAFVMIKATNLVEGWAIIDGTRDTINPRNKVLKPNSSNAEVSGSQFDIEFTDTGFVLNGTDDVINGYSGGTGEYIYMAFADTREAAFWKDVSGQGNHWTPNNLDYRDSLPDSPANNFAVLNPLHRNSVVINAYASLKEGNLNAFNTTDNVEAAGTLGVFSGKWYYEGRKVQSDDTSEGFGFHTNGQEAIYRGSAFFRFNGSQSSYGSTWDDGDVIGVALDLDNTSITFYKNGVSQGVAKSDLPAGTYLPFLYNRGANCSMTANFGQDSTFAGARPAGGNVDDNGIGDFAYAPPAGYLALCTENLPEPTIVDGSEHFNTVTYTGTGTTNAITGVGFSPDFVWGKQRSGVNSHELYDTVRGVNQVIYSDLTDAEGTNANGISSFDADGYTVAGNTSINLTSASVVAWNWKAGGTAVSNTAGSITSQVSANTDAGFSIVSYTGTGSAATVGHGLGVVPSIVIWKKRNGTTNWSTQSTLWADQKELVLNSTGALSATDSRLSTQSSWTSTTLDLGTYGDQNGSGGTYIAYCFANTDTTKAGSYVPNQSTDGTFIYLGFRPAFFLAKNISRTQEWIMMNNKTTDPYNPQDGSIQPNSSAAEGTGNEVDFLSNGVKLRNSGGGLNYASGDTFIYLAFAENPFKYANAR